jgi:geranylgeranyl diphosphate synthase type II
LDSEDLRLELLSSIENALKQLDLTDNPETLYKPYSYAMSVGGKRIRPLLTLLANGLCEGKNDNAIPAALAVEVLHNFTLVHDDIMDSADTRRGKPSVFKKWDENVAILSGDLMFADAYRFLDFYGASNEYSKEEYFSMNTTFNKAVITVCEGQAYDMEFVDRFDVSLKEYIQMISGKTGALLAASLKMGGIASHATVEQQETLYSLGMEMGIAFQIQDDLLDATADPEKFGKRPGGDIIEGKKTYLTILALERADKEQHKIITRILEDSESTQEHVNDVLDIMESLNVISDVNEIVQNHYQTCYSYIEQFEATQYRQELENLLIFLQNRDH